VLLALIVPAAIVLTLGGRLILEIFGSKYSDNAGTALVLLGLTAPIVAAADVCAVLLRTRPRVGGFVLMMACYAAAVIGLTVWWAGSGLEGVAWAWIVGNVVGLVVGLVILQPRRGKQRPAAGQLVGLEDIARERVPTA
jgi:O-antigen/teichoic acid export membrane protein